MENNRNNEYPIILLDFLAFLKNINYSNGTIDVYSQYIYQFFCFLKDYKRTYLEVKDFNVFFLIQVGRADIFAFLAYLNYKRKNCFNTRYLKLMAIRTFYDWIINNFLENKNYENPTCKMSNIVGYTKTPKYLNLKNARKIQKAFNSKNSMFFVRNNMIIILFLATGLRANELTSLDVNDVNLNEKVIFVKNGKGNKERFCYFNENCKKKLEEYLTYRKKQICSDEENALFLNKYGARLSKRSIQVICKNAFKLINLDEGYSCHTLRHTTATLTYEYVKPDVLLLKEILGHSNISSTQIYTHIFNKQLKNAINKNPLNILK